MPTIAEIAVHTIPHDDLPGLALTVAVIAAFWLTFAATSFCGAYYGAVAFRRTRGPVRPCARCLRRTTVHDGDDTKVVDLDHYRRRRRCRSHRCEPDSDEPA